MVADFRPSDQLKSADPDRYLSTLYAPEARRAALTALYAFNAEIAGIRDRIRDPLPGEIRLQWWREALAGDRAGEARANPLAAALLDAIAAHGLPLAAFERMLEARTFDLYDDPMPSRGDLEGYCGDTASTLIQLAAMILDRDAATAISEAAGHAGCAQAIAGLLRSLPIHRRRGQCYLPLDLLGAAGTDRDAFIAGTDRPSAGRAVAAMAALGRHHLFRFQASGRGMPAALRSAFLPLSAVPAYLERLEVLGAGALDEVAEVSAVRRQWMMLRRARGGWR